MKLIKMSLLSNKTNLLFTIFQLLTVEKQTDFNNTMH